MRLTYRMHTKDDRNELIRLWSEQSGWDVLDAKTWEHRFLDTPFGESAIALAIDKDTDAVVGQCMFIPALISIDGRELRAYRTFAPLLHQEMRGLNLLNPFKHPLYRMYKFATDFFAKTRVCLAYSMPDPRWLRAFQLLPNFQIGKFPLWSLKLPLEKRFGFTHDVEIREISPNDDELNELWRKTAAFYECAIVRHAEFLPWKTSHGNYFYQGVFRAGELVAFAASVFKQRDNQWLICDILAIDNKSLEAAIRASCNAAQDFQSDNSDKKINKAAILATDLMIPIVKKLNFHRDEYDFPFVVHLLDETVSKEEVAPSRWYLSAND